ncbi:aminodeoxychorismate lyase [Thiocapsa imhoffii]|uniref:Endolytic murein transglycosylase n=1 Tax=Thiocapsa imhoffii TaxID=382777 RepID=A0A9X1B8V7_9GAMM|nr:endolytic transglycosylase MltG [Thiocapsa imhoffii]MBK1645304.1 aminodeoxychorismate lyase [Thiocapsa imhoffii]
MIKRLLFVVFFILILLGSSLWLDYATFRDEPVMLPEPSMIFEIPRGTSLRTVARRLSEEGILKHPYYFIALAYERGEQSRIKAGEFELVAGMTPADVLARITSGQVVQYGVTLVEGWTFRQALAAIEEQPRFVGSLVDRSDADLMAELGHPGEHPEGRLFPDTYVFPRQTPRFQVLRRAFERMEQVLAEEWAGRQDDLPIKTPYEALILASIIEKETGAPHERAEIAGVFVRRLRQGMRLQTDPTVIYGMGDRYEGRIRRADLREATPYNTYVISGLPPTPIALPGRAAIHAALNPEDGTTLYFVSRGDGTHVFSETLAEHNRAVRRYILGQE